MILECGPGGADRSVCLHLGHMIAREATATMEFSVITLDNKRKLIANCGSAAMRLLEDGCDKVLVVWDLHPPWRDGKPCRKVDRDTVMLALRAAGAPAVKVDLICIAEELEAWLNSDGRALSTVLSTNTHPVRIPDHAHPDAIQNPKARLKRLFRTKRGIRYVDSIHAERIVRAFPDLIKVRGSSSFCRFEAKLLTRT